MTVHMLVTLLYRTELTVLTQRQQKITQRVVDHINTAAHHHLRGLNRMARYKSKIDKGWKFANIRLDRDQRDEFTEWSTGIGDDVIEVVTTVLIEGYKLSAKFDGENETWIATLTGQDESPSNARTSMSARHSSLTKAITLLCYKHLIVCNGGDWSAQVTEEEWG